MMGQNTRASPVVMQYIEAQGAHRLAESIADHRSSVLPLPKSSPYAK